MKALRLFFATLLAAALMAAAGCERRPLEPYYGGTVRVLVVCDWSYFPEVPTGMTMYFFRDGDATPRVISTSEIYRTAVNLPAGHWRMFLINQSVDEFASYEFFNMSDYSVAGVRLTEISSKWYTPTKASYTKNVYIGHAPENLGVALAEEFDITPEMVDRYQAAYRNQQVRPKNPGTKAPGDNQSDIDANSFIIPVTSHNIISKIMVRAYINNITVLAAARSGLSGMAQNFLLTEGHTSEGSACQLLEDWNIVIDTEDPTRGYIETESTSLGLPEGVINVEGRDSTLNTLNLNFLLKDKQIIDYKFCVGQKFKISQNANGLRLDLYLQIGYNEPPVITLPDIEISGETGGGFTADVVDWEEEINIGIPL